jgi:hypothetical protein
MPITPVIGTKRKTKVKKLILILAMCMSMTACGQHETVVYQQPAPVAVAQPVYVQNTDPSVGILTSMAIGAMMSNGMRYDGHNGYYDSHYRGPSRTVVVNKTVNNITVNKNVPASTNNPVSAVSAPVAPVAGNIPANPINQKSLDQKAIKANADKAAEAEQAKMKAEQAEKSRQAQLKSDLQAKQAARAAAPVPKTSGFNSMSKSASSGGSSKRK